MKRIGIGLADGSDKASRSSRPICRPCMDWSERRPHVAGKLGAAICTHCLENGWVRRRQGTRALDVTPKGRAALRELSTFTEGKAPLDLLRHSATSFAAWSTPQPARKVSLRDS